MKNKKIILVSNGEPYAHETVNNKIVCNKLAGGLTTGLDPIMQMVKGTWIAWGRGKNDFDVVDENDKVKVPNNDGYSLKRIRLTEEEVDNYYLGFSNEILWPISHAFISKANFKSEYWDSYISVNQKFADAVLEELNDDDNDDEYIWLQDYHLMLVPKMIRDKKRNCKISFFWHIPWPSVESFSAIPWRNDLFLHMLENDFLAFHTPHSVSNFLNCAEFLGADVDRGNNTITFDNSKTKVSAIPLGINYKNMNELSQTEEVILEAARIKENYNNNKIVFSVDRLDYTKGIFERIKAIECLFKNHPEYIDKVTFIQRVSPSRDDVQEYKDMRDEIERAVGNVNGKFQTDTWSPITYFYQSVPQEMLFPYYLAADIALITPLIDGLNLTAKEYIAIQHQGVLILSEFAGAAWALKDALHANPHNIEEVAEIIHYALEMSADEKHKYMSALKENVETFDINWWYETFTKEWEQLYD